MKPLREKEFFNNKTYLLVEEENELDTCLGCCFYNEDKSCENFEGNILNCYLGNGINGIYKIIDIEKFKKKKLII